MGDLIYWDREAMSQPPTPCIKKEDGAFSTTEHSVHKHVDAATENALWKQVLEDINTLRATELSKKYASEFNSWRNMKQRAKTKDYVVHASLETFKDFLYHAGPKPDPSYTYDRIDYNNPEYSPENCRWASKSLQSANRSSARLITDSRGWALSLTEWSRRTGISADTIRNRIDTLGWTVDEAVSVPAGVRRKKESTTGSKASGTKLGQLWELSLREFHNQQFCHLAAKHLKMLKDIAASLSQTGHPPEIVIRFVVSEWVPFCSYAANVYGAFKPPQVPTVEYLLKHLTAAGNYFLMCQKGLANSELQKDAQTQNQKEAMERFAQREEQVRRNLEQEERPPTREEVLALFARFEE